jgi:hypothetical protein
MECSLAIGVGPPVEGACLRRSVLVQMFGVEK